MKRKLLRYVSMLLITIALLSSCVDKDYDLKNIDDKISLNPSLGLPVGKIEYDIQEILRIAGASDKIMIEGDSIFIIYKDTLHLESNNSVKMPEHFSYYINPATVLPSGGTSTEFTISSDVDMENDIEKPSARTRVDSAMLLNSSIGITISNSFTQNTEFELILPQGLELTSSPVFTLSPGQNITKSFNIKDRSILKLTDFSFDIKYKLRRSSAFAFNSSDISVQFGFDNLDAEILWGFFGDISFDEKDEQIKLSIFDDVIPKNSKLLFHNPMIRCELRNYVGLDAKFTAGYVKAIGVDEDGAYEEVKAVFNTGAESYEIPIEGAPQPYSYSSIVRTFNRDNGGTNRLFEIYHPQYVDYKFKSDPIVHTNTENHFLVKGKYVDVLVDVRLPLSFDKGSILMTSDTLKFFDLISEEDDDDISDNVHFLKIRIKYENHLPIPSRMNISFLDDNKQKISDLEKYFEIAAAQPDALGNTLESKESMLYFYFDQDKWNDLAKTRYLLIDNELYHTNVDYPQTINFRPSDFIKFKIDVFGKINFIF